jgi:DNA primase
VREKRALLMEGYLDVARALERGVAGAVATCGTALTQQHARLLRRFAETVVLNFDQDDAGQKATHKSLELLLEEELRVRVVELPEGHDPDSYLKAEGASAYAGRLDGAPEAIEWLIRRAASAHDLGAPSGKAGFFAGVLPGLARIANPVERSAWLARVVERGGLDAAAAREELRRALGGRATGSSAVARAAERQARATVPAAALLPAERWLIALVTRGAAGVEAALDELDERDLAALRSAALLRAAQKVARRDGRLTLGALEAELPDEAERRLLTEIAVADVSVDALAAQECVRELRRQPLKARMDEIQRQFSQVTGEAQHELLTEKMRLLPQMGIRRRAKE